jgi:hypothetical protein
VAGNWIANGNQRNYDNELLALYEKTDQLNPLKQANVAGSSPSTFVTRLQFLFGAYRFNAATGTSVFADIRLQ